MHRNVLYFFSNYNNYNMRPEMIAPCGMNCCICSARLRSKNKCPSCRRKSLSCRIKNCPEWKRHRYTFCYHCPKFPCERNRHIDKRYREKYGFSLIENLEFIRDHGINKFIRKEQNKWISKQGVLCCHDKKYYPKEEM